VRRLFPCRAGPEPHGPRPVERRRLCFHREGRQPDTAFAMGGRRVRDVRQTPGSRHLRKAQGLCGTNRPPGTDACFAGRQASERAVQEAFFLCRKGVKKS
jgi:hypothetical protein